MSWWDTSHGLELPGPQRLIRRVARHLESGRTAVVVFPTTAVDSGLADHVIRDIENITLSGPVDLHDASGPCTALLRALRVESHSSDPALRWLALANSPAAHGTTRTITSWDCDVTELLQRWPRAVHARSGAPSGNPMNFLVGVKFGDYPAEAIDGIDRLYVDVTWWAGAISRLDSLVHAELHSDGTLTRLQQETIVEVCGWDLDTAEALLQIWDGDPDSLADDLAALPSKIQSAAVPANAPRSAPGVMPPKHRVAWNDGLLDLWDGSPRSRPSPDQIQAAIWRAQCAVLLPRLEEQRRRIQHDFWRYASASAILKILNNGIPPGHELHHELPGVDEVVLELGQMHFACSSGRVTLPNAPRTRLSALRDVRNSLAHGQPAPADRLNGLDDLLQ
jgi:hypothetical protein